MRQLLILVILALTAACSPIYVIRAGWEEAKILARREPIREVIADPGTSPAVRGKLELVLEAREFAVTRLGLEAGGSYTSFSRLDSDTLALIVSAAYRDRFEPYTWWFPIVGHVPYKGYFSEASARRAITDLEQRGFDTYLRPTSAFSTLGWFDDPLVSPLLRYDSVALANTVIHELLHNTYYASGQAMFNESFANFVGGRGAIEFFCIGEVDDSPQCVEARGAWHDDLLFSRFLDQLVAELEALYARESLTYKQTLAAREQFFDRARREFDEEIRPQLRTTGFARFERTPLNNASLLARRLYYHRLNLFDRVYQRYDGDFTRALDAILAAARRSKDDPYAGLEGLVR